MDTPNSLGVSLYNRETVLPAAFGYEQRGKGGTIAYGYRLRRFDSLSLLYGYERAHSVYQTVETPDPNGNIPIPSITDLNFTTSIDRSVVPLRLARQPLRHDARRAHQPQPRRTRAVRWAARSTCSSRPSA